MCAFLMFLFRVFVFAAFGASRSRFKRSLKAQAYQNTRILGNGANINQGYKQANFFWNTKDLRENSGTRRYKLTP